MDGGFGWMSWMNEEGGTWTNFRLRMLICSILDPAFSTTLGVHFGLFWQALEGQGTKEQVKYWIEHGAASFEVFYGCFGMTELGHGSNVAGVETTATFDQENDEFIVHTPTLTGTKWWIGGAAHTATHSSVVAQLVER